ncbi:MAG: heavy metal translocating P-type ATPase metal-binding domain-containing protein [Ignavibacteriaceae bacterium]|nr:heavy metal translocating P-type ATPase metal-binding domain-containing protein [Ignavibacteriaceae bacterium]
MSKTQLKEISQEIDIVCYHCGEICPSDAIHKDEKIFCCQGCKVVYEILNEKNLCTYYDLNESPGKTQQTLLLKNKYEYLDDAELTGKLLDFSDGKISTVTFFIPQMHCSSCIWLLENLFKIHHEILQSRVNFVEKKLSVSFQSNKISLRQVVELLAFIGYEPQISFEDVEKKSVENVNKKLYYKVGLAGFGFGNIMLLSFPEYLSIDVSSESLRTIFSYVIFLLSLPLLFYCGSEYFISAFKGLRKKFVNIDVPLSLGIVALFGKSAFEIFTHGSPGYMDSFAGLMFFLLLGKIFQNKTYDVLNFDRNYKSFFPISVTVKKNGNEKSIPLSQLKIGERIVVKNGELIPADAILFYGEGNIDYSFVTGESAPVGKVVGEMIYAGGRQIGSSIELEVLKDVSQSYLTQLWNNFQAKSGVEFSFTGIANSLSKYFTFAILLIAVLAFIYWIRIDANIAITAFITVLIVACPCALAMSTPFTLGNTLRIFGKNDFYVKNIRVLEDMAKVDTIVWDKTGTLTKSGETEIEFTGAILSSEENTLVKSLVRNSNHPLSKKIFTAIKESSLLKVENFIEIAGQGIQGEIAGQRIKIGGESFFALNKAKEGEETIYESIPIPVSSEVYLSINDVVKGKYKIQNKYRDEADLVIKQTQKKYDSYLLSGDNETEKSYLVNLFENEEKVFFRQSPLAKLNFIKKLQMGKQKILMLGDGLNDAGALAQSNVGISISEDILNFTPASDAILNAKMLKNLPTFLNFTAISLKIIYASFCISILYNFVGLYFAVQGLLSPLFSAILMPLSSISVVVFTTLTTTFFAKRKGLL